MSLDSESNANISIQESHVDITFADLVAMFILPLFKTGPEKPISELGQSMKNSTDLQSTESPSMDLHVELEDVKPFVVVFLLQAFLTAIGNGFVLILLCRYVGLSFEII